MKVFVCFYHVIYLFWINLYSVMSCVCAFYELNGWKGWISFQSLINNIFWILSVLNLWMDDFWISNFAIKLDLDASLVKDHNKQQIIPPKTGILKSRVSGKFWVLDQNLLKSTLSLSFHSRHFYNLIHLMETAKTVERTNHCSHYLRCLVCLVLIYKKSFPLTNNFKSFVFPTTSDPWICATLLLKKCFGFQNAIHAFVEPL